MVSSGYIPRFNKEMELGANYLLERGILITYVGWLREDRTFLQKLDISQIAQMSPETAQMFLDETSEDLLIEQLGATFAGINEKRAKKALKQLRETGYAELPVVKKTGRCSRGKNTSNQMVISSSSVCDRPTKSTILLLENILYSTRTRK